MFKSLGSALKRHEGAYRRTHNDLQKATSVVALFCQARLGLPADRCVRQCAVREEVLTIETRSKAIANELTLQLGELAGFLKEHEVKTKQIVIR